MGGRGQGARLRVRVSLDCSTASLEGRKVTFGVTVCTGKSLCDALMPLIVAFVWHMYTFWFLRS